MSIYLEIIKDYILTIDSIVFVFLFMILFLYQLKYIKTAYLYTILFLLILVFFGFLYSKNKLNIINQIIYFIEYISAFILVSIAIKYRKKISNFLHHDDQIGKILFFFSIVAGGTGVLFLSIGNHDYIFPTNGTTAIGNFYFNADTYRCIRSAINSTPQNLMHPYYRFILNIFVIPYHIYSKLWGHSWLICGYYIVFLQLVWSSVSVYMIYRITKENGSKNTAIFASIFYLFSFSFIWTIILPETYALTTCVLLVSIYAQLKKSSYSYALSLLTIGMNPITCIAFVPFLWRDRIKISSKFRVYISIILLLLFPVFVISASTYISTIINYKSPFNIINNLKKIYFNLFQAGIYGPSFEYREPFFFQIVKTDYKIFFCVFVIFLSIIGIIKNRNDILCHSVTIMLITGIAFHGIIGFGPNFAILYSPLYVWAIVILVAKGISLKYIPMKVTIPIIIISTAFGSVLWINNFQQNLKQIVFPLAEWRRPSHEFLIGSSKVILVDNCLYIVEDSSILIERIDSFMISKNTREAVGILKSGEYFEVHEKNGVIVIDISD